MEPLKTLDELDILLEGVDEEVRQQFKINDDSGAEWCLRKIRQIRSDNERLSAICKQQIEFYRHKLAMFDEKAEKDSQWFVGKLREYFMSVTPRDTKTQAIYELPGGKLVLKKAKHTYKHDDEAIIARLKASGNTSFVKTTERLDWAEYKKTLMMNDGVAVDTNGEVIAEITAEIVPERFEIEV